MTVVKRAAAAALNFLTRSGDDAPVPVAAAGAVAGRAPAPAAVTAPACATGGSIVPRPERRAPWPRQTDGLPPGKRERRVRVERRRTDRRKVDLGSPYGAERRSGHDDRQGDRRARAGAPRAGIGLARDYFAPPDPAPVISPASDVPAHLLIRFNS